MSRYGGAVANHRRHCTDPDCVFCQDVAEGLADDIEPDYDVEAAENSFERAMGW